MLISRAPVPTAEAQTNDLRQRLISLLSISWFVIFLVLYLVWLFRSKRKSVELGAHDVRYTPGLAVGCHFIPFANLFMPYQAMSELWKASLNPADWKTQRGSAVAVVWWLFWILGGIAGYAVMIGEKGKHGIDHLRHLTQGIIVSSLLMLVSLCVLFWLVGKISHRLASHQAPAPALA